MFIFFNSQEHPKHFHIYLNSLHGNIYFIIEIEKGNKMPFLNVKIICEHGNHFYSPLPSICKIGMSHTLPCRAFWICSNWSKIHLELVQLMFSRKVVTLITF